MHPLLFQPFLRDSSDRSFYDFDLKSLRQPQDSLSVFALLVSANLKLQNIMQTSQSVTLRSVRNAVAAIFHVPKEVRDQTPSLIPPSHQHMFTKGEVPWISIRYSLQNSPQPRKSKPIDCVRLVILFRTVLLKVIGKT